MFNLFLKTQGEEYWFTKNKFYFVNRAEWMQFKLLSPRKCDHHQINYKKINYPIQIDTSPLRSKSAYFPVTKPRTFRRSFTRLRIKKNQIVIYKHVNN